MKRTLGLLFAATIATAAPTLAMAGGENNVGSCGWGSKLFEGQSGIIQQVLAVTTNGTSGNQTFGITSGTSGCTQDGTVSSTWKTAMFIDGNKEALAKAISAGQGESLDALAALIGIDAKHKADFSRVSQVNFARIFPSTEVSAAEIRASLKEVVSADAVLAQYSAKI